jgi:hypothetical protein
MFIILQLVTFVDFHFIVVTFQVGGKKVQQVVDASGFVRHRGSHIL